MKKNTLKPFSILAIICGLLAAVSCTPVNRQLKVVIHLERKDLAQSSLLVFNFHEPPHAEGMGAYTAERFHVHLLEAKKFKTVGLYQNSPWNRLGETEEERLLSALEQGRDKSFDYILVGELTDFYDGVMNQSRIDIKIRLIEVHSRITIFLAENHRASRGKDPSYPMMTTLSQRSAAPKVLAEKMIEEMIKQI